MPYKPKQMTNSMTNPFKNLFCNCDSDESKGCGTPFGLGEGLKYQQPYSLLAPKTEKKFQETECESTAEKVEKE
jgi:hypothetical protein